MGLAGSKILRLCCPILRLCWSILGQCWPTLALCWPVLGPRLADLEAYVDPCWAKRSKKKWEQKNTVKRMIFWWVGGLSWAMLAHLGAMLAYLEAMWAHLGLCWPILGLCCISWGQCGPILGLCWPSLGLSWPILGLCWPILGLCWPSWGLSSPCWAILSHKIRKIGKKENSKIHCKTQDILATRGLRRLGRRPLSPIRRGENCRTAMPRPGGPWPDYQCAAAKLLNFSTELAKLMGSDCLSKASSMQKLEN